MAFTWGGKGNPPPPDDDAPDCTACNGAGKRNVEVHDLSKPRDQRVSYEYKTCPDCSGSGKQ